MTAATLVGTTEFCQRTGLTYRQVDHWTRTGVLLPAVPANGSGIWRGWSDDEVRVGRVVGQLAALHVKRPKLRQVAATVRWSPAPWVRIGPSSVTGVYAPRDDGAVYLSTAVAS